MKREVRKLSSLDFTKYIFHLLVFKIASTDVAHTIAHYTYAVSLSWKANELQVTSPPEQLWKHDWAVRTHHKFSRTRYTQNLSYEPQKFFGRNHWALVFGKGQIASLQFWAVFLCFSAKSAIQVL